MSRPESPEPQQPPEAEQPADTEESREDAEHPEPIQARPTANPARVRMPAEGWRRKTDEGDPETSGPPPGEET
ncbi:hypothetical protein [Micromonospora musae]|uniref:hypothetical protein n=1 Tax=Micromonospora musae TaxID=1894970 RepID=UPI0033F75A0C